jgi:hypothetical protein
MQLLEQGIGLEQALAAWDFGGQVAGALRFGKGHINDTFAVYTQQADTTCRRFILQRINTRVFTDPAGLMENITGVTGYLRGAIAGAGGDPNRETLTVAPTKEGKSFFTAENGDAWRVYYFIEDAVCYQTAETPELFRVSAVAFGNFARQLQNYPAHTLRETIPNFHHTPTRFKALQRAIAANSQNRAKACAAEIEFALAREADCAVLTNLQEKGELPLRVTHNDTKLNNIMIDPKTMRGVCVIDLDTVMPGLWLNDYGDSIRFGAHGATEDERDLGKVSLSLPLFETYTDGYLEAAGPVLTPLEKELMPWGARLMTLECGIRFLADFLEGDVYFKTARPAHNLDRCRTQFKLVTDMERAWDEINAIVKRLAGAR